MSIKLCHNNCYKVMMLTKEEVGAKQGIDRAAYFLYNGIGKGTNCFIERKNETEIRRFTDQNAGKMFRLFLQKRFGEHVYKKTCGGVRNDGRQYLPLFRFKG